MLYVFICGVDFAVSWLRAYDNSTCIYLAAGEIFGGERFMEPLRTLFPRLENRTTVTTADELIRISIERVLWVLWWITWCVYYDVFMPTYDGPSNFANNLLGHRLYSGFRTSIRPDRKALAPLFMEMEEGSRQQEEFEEKIKAVMRRT